jgi:hypothetical protein
LVKKYLKYIKENVGDDYDPEETMEMVGLPSGLYFEIKKKEHSKIQNLCNWSDKLRSYTYKDENYNKILFVLDREETSSMNEESMIKKIKALGITNRYVIENDKYITIFGNVKLNNRMFGKLPFKIHKVTGDFHITHSSLVTLENCPSIIEGNFECSFNKLKELYKGPLKVGGLYNCSHNSLTSLYGSPLELNGFDCSYNKLINLEYGPQFVDGDYDCSHNNIKSLNSAPVSIKGIFDCRYNLLNDLKGLPKGVIEVMDDFNPMSKNI